MKKILLITFLVNYVAFSQDMKTVNRSVSNFKGVKVSSGIDLYLNQGNAESLSLTAQADKLDEIETFIKDNILYIQMRNSKWGWNWGNRTSPKVKLQFKDLNIIVANGGSDVFSEERLLFDKITIEVNGGSDVKIDLSAEALDCRSSGGSDAILTGSAKNFRGNASGGSDLKAKELRTQNSKVTSSGGSDAHVWVEESLEANASGGSDIYYYGSPKNVKRNKSGGSDISRR